MRHVRVAFIAVALSVAGSTDGASADQQPACGVDRWSVKMWDDRDAAVVDTMPIDVTLSALAKLPIPDVVYPNDARLPPHELRVYRVRVIIDQIKTESDGDWHLILRDAADPTSTLIAEIPAPACAKNARNALRYQAARDSLRRVPRRGVAIVTGVGFWDFIHNQRGGARNGFELHPVLAVVPIRTAP